MPRHRRESFKDQLDVMGARRRASIAIASTGSVQERASIGSVQEQEEEREDLKAEISNTNITEPFESKFDPLEMRQLALVAHNHMKPAM